MNARYGIYFVPEATAPLYRFGAGILGYDCYTGATLPHPSGLPEDWAALTEAPRVYGFHATLKAPFRLAPGADEPALLAAMRDFAARRNAVPAFEAQVTAIGDFVALVPRETPARLNDLAEACVVEFDAFRAPQTPAERARRLAAPLSERQAAYVGRWGYPYVFDEFRWHMTLTGPLPRDRQPAIAAQLAHMFAAACADAGAGIAALALVRQTAAGGPFRVIARVPLGAGEPRR